MPVRELVPKVHVEPPATHKPTGRKTVIRALTNTGIGAAAFLITCLSLRVVLPFPEIDDGVSQKFRFFATHKDEFDTLFLGSSRVYFQISPAIFDHVTRESGLPTHTFNFGIGGMYLPETSYLLEQILNLKPRNLKWVFIEYDELQTKWSPENQTSRRALYWADWKRVSLLLRKLTDAGTDPLWLPSPGKIRDIVLRQKDEKNTRDLLTFYATQFERNYTNVSRGADVLDFFLRRDTKERRAKYLGAASDGYVSRPNRMSPNQVAAYERGLAAMAQTDARALSPYTMAAYRQCAQEVRKIGAAPIFLITPSITQINVATDSAGLTGVVMAFNNPRTYPSLYRSSVHRDGQHLTQSGAEEFTRIVAANFVELARAGGIK
ncbi:MAG: hypothetical protein DMF26_13360 [Verrucomicrobia bacterium]|nr:MAG: hypothetical protein DMF26_13360 [Verrucomicrobiota bacterium]